MNSLTQSEIFAKYLIAITPKEIDRNLTKLSNVFLPEELSSLPPISGVYIVTDVDYYPILYIGQSINILARIRSHNKKKAWFEACETCDTPRIIWIEISDLSLLNFVEQALIEYFDPPLNVKGRLDRYEMKKRNDYVQKMDNLQTSDNFLYCNGFPIAWLYSNKLSEIQIKRILNSYQNIDWPALSLRLSF